MKQGLLIVPYGIETRRKRLMKREEARLLIVPYGIETLLIVSLLE